MPEPTNYDNENDWMGACVPKMVEEGRDEDQAVAACMSMWRERKSYKGMTFDEIIQRFLEKEIKELKLDENMLVNFGSPVKGLNDIEEPDFAIVYGGEDLTGDYFDNSTEYGFAGAQTKRVPILFHHAQPLATETKRYQEKKPIGEAELEISDDGILIKEAVLYNRKKYIEILADLGWSTGAASHAVIRERKADGRNYIKQWIISELSVTPISAEPRIRNVIALKSLITPNGETGEEPPSGDTKTVPEQIQEKENNNMDEKELKAMLESNNETFTKMLADNQTALLEKVTEQAESAAKKAVDDVLDKLPEVKAKMNGKVEVTVDEADREFKTVGDNCIAVYRHIKGIQTHPRIKGLQAKAIAAAEVEGDQAALEAAYKAALGSNEAVPSQGEFLLEPTITQTLLAPMHETGIFSTKVNRLPVGPNSNSGWIPGVDETSRAAGSRWGGVRGYHAAEAASMTASQPKFRRINWELHKAYVLQYATDELLRDAGMLTAIINQSSAEELDFMVNDDILNGVGGDRPLGVLNSGPLIAVPRYTASQVNHVDLTNMWQRMLPRYKGGAEWYINSEVEPQLQKLAFASNAATTEMMSPFVSYRPDGTLTIFGRPVNVTEYNAALGTAGDILLANFSDYLFWEKGAIEAAMSIHVQFLTDQTAFRFVARYDGQTALASALTPYKGSNTQSPFVDLSASTS